MKNLRTIAGCAAASLLLTFFAIIAGCAAGERAGRLCNAVDVQLLNEYEFVTAEEVSAFIEAKYGPCLGMRLDSLDLGRIEELLDGKGVVLKSEAWATRDGVLHVSIVQRAPVLRFSRGEEGFYIDRSGYVFPLHRSYTADVPVVSGNIPGLESEEGAKWAAGVLELVDCIQGSGKWKDRMESMSVNRDGDLELRLAGSRERFIIGYPDNIGSKMDRIGKYYSHIVPAKGEGFYKSVNLKYNKQIICRKDI